MRSKSPVKMPQPQQHPAAPGKPAIDYHVLLLSLADEYIDAAHSQGTALAVAREETETDEYYKLIATGLACLEAVLKVGLPTHIIYCSDTLNLGPYKCNIKIC